MDRHLASALLIPPMGFYLACLGYLVVAQLLFYLTTMTMIILYYCGVSSTGVIISAFAAASFVFDAARTCDPAMYATGAVAFCLLLWPRKRGLSTLVVIAVLFVAGLAADLTYGISPLSEVRLREKPYNANHKTVAHKLSVEEIMYLKDSISGSIAESEGTLDHQPNMNRFILRSLEEPGNYVKVFFFKGRRTNFSEMRDGGKPRYHDVVQPFVGKKVRILGTVVNGQIDADISDVQVIP